MGSSACYGGNLEADQTQNNRARFRSAHTSKYSGHCPNGGGKAETYPTATKPQGSTVAAAIGSTRWQLAPRQHQPDSQGSRVVRWCCYNCSPTRRCRRHRHVRPSESAASLRRLRLGGRWKRRPRSRSSARPVADNTHIHPLRAGIRPLLGKL